MSGNRKLLVTGATGFVGGHVLQHAEGEIHAVTRGSGQPLPNVVWHSFENAADLAALIRKVQPAAVIHGAAIADIDFAEKNPDQARYANLELTQAVVSGCVDTGCKMVFCSTDAIFDGEHAPYNEGSAPRPVNYYAQTKVEGERLVQSALSEAVIARLALVIGMPAFGSGNAFLPKTVLALKEGRPISAPQKEIRTPIDVMTVATALIELAHGKHRGIYHLAGHTRINRVDMLKTIANAFGFPNATIVDQPAGSAAGRAPRPRDVSLDNSKVCAQLKTPMRTLAEALTNIVKRVGK